MAFVQFSTQGYREAERLDAVQETFADIVQCDIKLPQCEQPHVDARIRLLPGVSVALLECSSMTLERGRRHFSDDNDDVILLFNPGGSQGQKLIYQQGKDVLNNPTGVGCAGFTGTPGSLAFQGPGARLLSVCFPRRLLASQVVDLERRTRTQLAPGEHSHLLMQQALQLTSPSRRLSPGDFTREAEHLLDLAALTLGPTRDAGARALSRGLSAARLLAMKNDIVANADNGDLCLEWLAGRHGISPRNVRALFERSGISFTDYLLEQRLQRSFARLSSPAAARWPVADIAYASGFNNLSWFYRAFCRRFGLTPGDVQASGSLALSP